MLYKVEYWVQYEGDQNAKKSHEYVCFAATDRQAKTFVSVSEKFYPEFCAPWKTSRDDEEAQVFTKSFKKKVLNEFKPMSLKTRKTLKRYLVLRKPLTSEGQDKLDKECNGLARWANGMGG